jgi:thiosulfate dehydrogenase
LSNEEAWDVAAFINSQPRPIKRFTQDWQKKTRIFNLY